MTKFVCLSVNRTTQNLWSTCVWLVHSACYFRSQIDSVLVVVCITCCDIHAASLIDRLDSVYALSSVWECLFSRYVYCCTTIALFGLEVEVEVCHTPLWERWRPIRLVAWASPKGAHGKKVWATVVWVGIPILSLTVCDPHYPRTRLALRGVGTSLQHHGVMTSSACSAVGS